MQQQHETGTTAGMTLDLGRIVESLENARVSALGGDDAGVRLTQGERESGGTISAKSLLTLINSGALVGAKQGGAQGHWVVSRAMLTAYLALRGASLTVPEYAARKGVSEATIYRRIREGVLESVIWQRRYYIARTETRRTASELRYGDRCVGNTPPSLPRDVRSSGTDAVEGYLRKRASRATRIVRVVAETSGYPDHVISGPCREEPIAQTRRVLIALLHENNIPRRDICTHVKRTPETVLYHIRGFQRERNTEVDALMAASRAALAHELERLRSTRANDALMAAMTVPTGQGVPTPRRAAREGTWLPSTTVVTDALAARA